MHKLISKAVGISLQSTRWPTIAEHSIAMAYFTQVDAPFIEGCELMNFRSALLAKINPVSLSLAMQY